MLWTLSKQKNLAQTSYHQLGVQGTFFFTLSSLSNTEYKNKDSMKIYFVK